MRIIDVQTSEVLEEEAAVSWEERTTPGTRTTFSVARLTGPRKALLFRTSGLDPRIAKKIRTVLSKCHQMRSRLKEVRIEHGAGKEDELALFAELRPSGWEHHMRDVLKRIESGVDRTMRAAARDAAKAANRQPASVVTA